jgi:hypothetical protein
VSGQIIVTSILQQERQWNPGFSLRSQEEQRSEEERRQNCVTFAVAVHRVVLVLIDGLPLWPNHTTRNYFEVTHPRCVIRFKPILKISRTQQLVAYD